MFSFLHQIFRPIGNQAALSQHAVPSNLLDQANTMAGHDAHAAAQLRQAAVLALGVVR